MAADYQIKTDGRNFFGVSALSERAQTRTSGPPATSDLTTAFRTKGELIEFVQVNEGLGYTFAGKELLP